VQEYFLDYADIMIFVMGYFILVHPVWFRSAQSLCRRH